MTWKEFVTKVETQLRDKNIHEDVELDAISWDRAAFGGPIPDVYVNDPDGDGRIVISED